MMTRLRDKMGDPDPVLSRAAEIVASMPRLSESEIRKERIRRAVLQGRIRRLSFSLLLRPAVLGAVLLVASAGAARDHATA